MSTHILGESAPASAQPPTAYGEPHRRAPLVTRTLRSFRYWRKRRPFVAGLLAILSGIELLAAPLTSLGVMIHEGVTGFSASFFGPLLIVFGCTIWFAPAYRMFAGIATILLGLIALPTINLGGFFIGTLLALTGGMMAVAWAPRPGWTAPTRRERRRTGARAVTGDDDPARTEPLELMEYTEKAAGQAGMDQAQDGQTTAVLVPELGSQSPTAAGPADDGERSEPDGTAHPADTAEESGAQAEK